MASKPETLSSGEFEKAILGCLLRFPDNISFVVDGLTSDDFYSHRHKAIFTSVLSLLNKKSPIDALLLSREAKLQGWDIPTSEIFELGECFFDGQDIDHYKALLKSFSRRRNLEAFLSSSLQDVRDPANESDEVEGKIVQGIMGIFNEGTDRERKTPKDLFSEVMQTYYERKIERERGRRIFGIPSGFSSLDAVLGGHQAGRLGILAGRQHHGKSTVAMDIFLNAIQAGFPSLYLSLEQPSAEVLLHLIQKPTGIKPLNVKTGNLSEGEERLLTGEIFKRFNQYPMALQDQARTLNEVVMTVRRMVLSRKVRFAVMDYLQLVENRIKGEPRHIEVAGISRALKRLAMDLDISILALSQLNKSPEERESKRISLADMRESEAISQDADYVIFIHRPVLMGKDDKDHLELAKNRYGETVSRINVVYDRVRNTYREMGENDEPKLFD